MLSQPMIEKLLVMRLNGMAEGLQTQEQDPAARELSFLERLGLLVDQQWSWRQNQALARRLKTAKLRGTACVEDIDYRAARGLDKSVVRALTQESAWVRNHENIFVLGPTGVGKSFLASALAQKACRDGYTALNTRAAALFRDLALARADACRRRGGVSEGSRGVPRGEGSGVPAGRFARAARQAPELPAAGVLSALGGLPGAGGAPRLARASVDRDADLDGPAPNHGARRHARVLGAGAIAFAGSVCRSGVTRP